MAGEGLVTGWERRGRTTPDTGSAAGATPVVPPIGRLAVVVNPSKFEQWMP